MGLINEKTAPNFGSNQDLVVSIDRERNKHSLKLLSIDLKYLLHSEMGMV